MDFNNNSSKYEPKYMYDRKGRVVAYCNGACNEPGKTNSHGGVGVWFGFRNPLNVSGRVRGRQTSNSAQIQAVTNALWQAKHNGIDSVHIYTNSDLVYKAYYKYFEIWLDNGWINAQGRRVVNFWDWKYLLKAKQGMDVVVTFVGNSRPNKGRDISMRLARRYAERT